MTRTRSVLIAPLFLLAAGALRADEVDALVATQMRERHIAGLSLAVVREGKVILAKGYGLANVEHGVPAKPKTVYQSGSVGKQFTAADIVPNRVAGYRLVGGELKNQEWVSPSLNTTADGALYLTVLDLAKWDAARCTERLLNRASLEQMWTPATTTDGKAHPYGFGWALGEAGGRRVVEHGGAWQGLSAGIVRYPNGRLTVVVLTNLSRANPGSIARGVADFYLRAAVDIAVPPRGPRTAQPRGGRARAAPKYRAGPAPEGRRQPGLALNVKGQTGLRWSLTPHATTITWTEE